jgi:glycosyltransferase involved in cell wall biosynthesis
MALNDDSELAPARRFPKIAMLVSRFPKVNDTYQLREMNALEKMGVPIELFSLVHHQEGTVHDEAKSLDSRAHYFKLLSPEVIKAQLTWLRRDPSGYLAAWKWGIRENKSAPDFFLRTFVLTPIAAAMALRMEALGIEHVHAHFATYPTHAALVIKRLTGIPYSFTGHAHDIQVRHEGLQDKLAEAEFYFCCTRDGAEQLRLSFGEAAESKGHVVYHGLDIDQFRFLEPNPDHGDRPLRIVVVASFEPCKGHAYLIEACRILKQRGIETEVKLIGGELANAPGFLDELKQQTNSAGLSDSIDFVGKVNSTKVREWIEWSDIGCLACCRAPDGHQDGIPNFLTECLSSGRPVVSSLQAGVMELVTDGVEGLLVRTRDSEALAGALQRMKEHPELRAEMGRAGRDKVEREHNVTVNTNRLHEIYLEEVGRDI